jgi:hypothetical protein
MLYLQLMQLYVGVRPSPTQRGSSHEKDMLKKPDYLVYIGVCCAGFTQTCIDLIAEPGRWLAHKGNEKPHTNLTPQVLIHI